MVERLVPLSETYDIVKLICLLILVLLNLNLVNVNHLIYRLLINFGDRFHYFCEDKTPKIERLNHKIASIYLLMH